MVKEETIKTEINEKQYKEIKAAEKAFNLKLENLTALIVHEVDGEWGIYRVTRAYKRIKYFAHMKLMEICADEEEAHGRIEPVMRAQQIQGAIWDSKDM